MNDETPSYGQLSSQTASKLVDVAADFSQRAIHYSRSILDILMTPYAAKTARAAISEGFDRATEVATVSARAAKAQIDASQDTNKMLLDQAMQIQDAYLNALRGVLDITFSNMTFVQEAASTVSVDSLAKRFDEYTSHGSGASIN